MIIAAVSISGIKDSPSVSEGVRAALRVFEERGARYVPGAMFTTLEVESIDELFDVLADAYRAVQDTGARRIIMSLKTDQRFDKDLTIEGKLSSASIEHSGKK